MIATAFTSMWVSNTAAALMMLPVAMAVLECDTSGKLGVPLLLGIAYSASIGGVATPIGTPPNGVFLAAYKTATGNTVPFHEWLLIGGIVAVLMLVVAWVVLTWKLGGVPIVDVETEGEWTTPQKRVLTVLGLTALAWITREIPFGGWSALVATFVGPTEAGDTTVALVAVVVLFLLPSGARRRQAACSIGRPPKKFPGACCSCSAAASPSPKRSTPPASRPSIGSLVGIAAATGRRSR